MGKLLHGDRAGAASTDHPEAQAPQDALTGAPEGADLAVMPLVLEPFKSAVESRRAKHEAFAHLPDRDVRPAAKPPRPATVGADHEREVRALRRSPIEVGLQLRLTRVVDLGEC